MGASVRCQRRPPGDSVWSPALTAGRLEEQIIAHDGWPASVESPRHYASTDQIKESVFIALCLSLTHSLFPFLSPFSFSLFLSLYLYLFISLSLFPLLTLVLFCLTAHLFFFFSFFLSHLMLSGCIYPAFSLFLSPPFSL